ncbi:glycosyltransferase family 4 protein [Peribacillus simplex]|uniref:glycosyltransferase family 4 protein n=1 Tax=Peribacillus simplex TaxID=1478 RepID=UPI003D2C8728
MLLKPGTKICFVTAGLGFGGAERVISTLSNFLADNGVKVTILTVSNFFEEPAFELRSSIKVCRLKYGRVPILRNIQHIKKIRKAIIEINSDIVISFLSTINIYTLISLIGSKVPIIVSERNDPKMDPKVVWKRILRNLIYPLSSGYVFQTEEAKNYFSKEIREKGVVIPNPLMIRNMPRVWEKERRKEIVAVGRLEDQKNYPLLLKAFSKLSHQFSDYKLIIYGDGSKKEQLEMLCENLNISNKVLFAGIHKDVLNRINGAKLYVLSSNYEGMPNALMEAMAVGLPCISTDCPCGGPRYLIEHETNGLLVELNNVDQLTRAIETLLSNNNKSIKISKEAIKIRENLSIEQVTSMWEKYIIEILGDM